MPDNVTNDTARGSNGQNNAHAVAVRVPTFWPDKISLWFKQLEAQFTIAGVTRDSTKFSHVIANLEPKYIEIEEIEDIIENPPAKGQYDAVKAGLIKRLSDSSNIRIRKLLESEEIGDRTPSQFLSHLKTLAGSGLNEDFLSNLFLNRLPVSTQHVLAPVTGKSLTTMAEMADRIHEIRPEKHRVAEVAENSEIAALREELKNVSAKVSAISQGPRGRGRWRGRSQSRGRNSSQHPRDRNSSQHFH